jgi:hypothetical protein
MTCHTCTAAYYRWLSRYHQRTSAFFGRKAGAAHEGRQEPASSGLEAQTKEIVSSAWMNPSPLVCPQGHSSHGTGGPSLPIVLDRIAKKTEVLRID